MANSFFVGLDLGQQADFTSIAIVEAQGARRVLRQLDRRRGRAYTSVAADVATLCSRQDMSGAVLAVDATGVGLAVVDMLKQQLPGGYSSGDAKALETLGVKGVPRQTLLVPVTITGGQTTSPDGKGGFHTAKKDLVSPVLVLFEQRQLILNREDRLADELVKELHNFQIKITKAAHETFEAAGSGHDDLVIAVALACWAADRFQGQDYTGPLLCTDGAPEEPKRPETRDDTLRDLGYFNEHDSDMDDKGPWR